MHLRRGRPGSASIPSWPTTPLAGAPSVDSDAPASYISRMRTEALSASNMRVDG